MNKLMFVLFGRDTLEEVDLSYGGRYREHWTLDQHPGSRIETADLGGKLGKVSYLYPHHLGLLYERFRQSNPSGIEMGINDALEMRYEREHGLSRDLVNALSEQRRMYVNVTSTDEHLGYPHLRPYLPEIFMPEVVAAMEADVWLDAHELDRAIMRGDVPDSRERHPRWSPEWRAYCDGLARGKGVAGLG